MTAFVELKREKNSRKANLAQSSNMVTLKSIWPSFVPFVFYARKQLLLSARLSHRNSVRSSVCLSHGWTVKSSAS